MTASQLHGNPPLDTQVLQRVFSGFPEVEAVLLFGSEATGRKHLESDLDLAIVARDPEVAKKKLDMLEALAFEGYCNVDLVILKRKDVLLAFEAFKHRRVVYQRESFDFPSTYSLILRQYFDFVPYLAVHRKTYQERLRNGSGRNPEKTPGQA